mmetsp:Transcript_15470/g.27971  ORF Transcript_15470/g.27971 Transcript_15470/m.27971 type:complete len:128 (+) Transcript_15470:340-723(+)
MEEQLRFFRDLKKRKTTTVDLEMIRNMAEVVDRRYIYMPKTKGAQRQYFNTPNNMPEDMQMAQETLRSSQLGRKTMRAQSREQDQEDQDKREAFSNMTYDQYQAECTASESKIRSLEVACRQSQKGC